MNPVTLPPIYDTRRLSASSKRSAGRFQLSEYSDDVYKSNIREEMMLVKRLSSIERQRAGSSAAMRKSFQTTEKLVETLQADTFQVKRQPPTLAQYDEWRNLSRYSYGKGASYVPGGMNNVNTSSSVGSRGPYRRGGGAKAPERKLTPYVASGGVKFTKKNSKLTLAAIGELDDDDETSSDTSDDRSPKGHFYGKSVYKNTNRKRRRHTVAYKPEIANSMSSPRKFSAFE